MPGFGLSYGIPFRYGGGGWTPRRSDPLQDLYLYTAPATATDKTANALDADYVGSPCASVLNGATLTVTGLVGTETITNSGTATPTPTADTITFAAGTVYELKIGGTLVYPVGEGVGSEVSSIIPLTWPDATFSANTWTTQDAFHDFAERGGSKVLSFDGLTTAGTVVNTPESLRDVGNVTLEFSGEIRELPVALSTAYLITCEDDNEWESGNKLYSLRVNSDGSVQWFHEYGFGHNEIIDTGVTLDLDTSFDIVSIRDATAKTVTTTINGGASNVVSYVNNATKAASGNTQKVMIGATKLGAFFSGLLYHASITTESTVAEFSSSTAYSDTLPNTLDDTGETDATLVNTELLYYSALADGTDDVAGLGITNPKCDETNIHNNGPFSLKQKAANNDLLDNEFWSANGSTYNAKTFAQLRAHLNFDDNVVICSTASSIVAGWTWLQAYQWTPANYQKMIDYLSRNGCTGTSLKPLLDDDSAYILDDDGYIIFED